MTVTTAKWSVEDYHHMIETGLLDDRPVELLNGEIIEMTPEREPHAFYSRTSAKYLEVLLGEQAEVLQGKPITMPSNNSEPQPDIAVVQPLGREYLQHHPYPENIFLLIEFSHSSLKKDLDPKAKAYAAAGIAEYWVVNLRTMELIVMRDPVEGEYRSQVTWREDTINPLAFADVSVSVNRMLS
ncbi:MAG: Uma2 family endonuclease [Drouetiella hepatica Uher 2000/2452]|jgi:Uma2 family endonuclease|uniref:Uma2 family endonuclease n=1 Tax=Drouetiella hepatica Uher 2000/2452 TaxID=904376 RepID=A0A951UPP2_9CYAN|nr:Uma2 family endonuclease [Drouetiella hepatica Uher 2000/2452]